MKILLYADLDLRLIDGSSTWLASLAEVLSSGGHEVHVLSKVRFIESRVLDRLRDRYPEVQIHMPADRDPDLSPNQAASRAVRLRQKHDFDVIITRGFAACLAFSEKTETASVLWSYITDLPFPIEELSNDQSERLQRVATASRRMFAQTEAARSYLEAVAPAAAGKTLLMPPMIPDEAFERDSSAADTRLRLIYAGKMAKPWHTYEMLDLPRALAGRGVDAELVVVGDKFQHHEQDPTWAKGMREALVAAHEDPDSHVTWLGGIDRNRVLHEISKAHVGIGWRSAELDASLEVSTKALEYAACETAPLLNVSADHLSLWGEDYPLIVGSDASVEQVADRIANIAPDLALTAAAAREVATEYSMSAAATRLKRYLVRGARSIPRTDNGTKIVISSHDFKFLGELVDGLRQRADIDLQFDGWTSLHTHDESSSIQKKADADVVFCEWAGPSLVWHAEHKNPGTKLVVRLHGFELRGPWLETLKIDGVDHWVFVSERYRQIAVENLKLAPEKTSVIPNMIESDDFNRPKLAGSQFQLGMAGIVGYGKRPDRALDLLELLLESDERYMLRIKGRPPWDYPHEWRDPLQRQLYLDFYARIRNSKHLQNRVVFESFSPDIASWLRGVGFILSPSHNESFHLAPVEGMASGAVPVIWERPGAEEIFGREWIVQGADEAAQRIVDLNNSNKLADAAGRARRQSLQWDRDRILNRWFDVLGVE
ncbi:glycosyltransferase [Brevibacterium sp.]|uniref:glycosyltransferase n=1 Tax=Brevibacterium sp. TaxID=1701 RepID=UPI0028111D01|nr:glycosyltransferase [Brevibacterium sp.]